MQLSELELPLQSKKTIYWNKVLKKAWTLVLHFRNLKHYPCLFRVQTFGLPSHDDIKTLLKQLWSQPKYFCAAHFSMDSFVNMLQCKRGHWLMDCWDSYEKRKEKIRKTWPEKQILKRCVDSDDRRKHCMIRCNWAWATTAGVSCTTV